MTLTFDSVHSFIIGGPIIANQTNLDEAYLASADIVPVAVGAMNTSTATL